MIADVKSLKVLLILVMILSTISCQVTQEKNTVTPTDTRVVKPGTGRVTGILTSKETVNLKGLLIYLGSIINGPEGFVAGALDTKTARSVVVDEKTGTFSINDVEAGKYSLIIYEVEAGGKALLDGEGNIKVIQVFEGKTVDLGTLILDDLINTSN